MYDTIYADILTAAKSITLSSSEGDGRLDSAMKEGPFLIELKRILLEKNPEWSIVIPKERSWCDIIIQAIPINLKLTEAKTADNCANKRAIFFSITGSSDYPYSSTWNDFYDKLSTTPWKAHRNKATEYHYLVKNKLTGAVLLKAMFDIHTYVSNPSNDLQINWKNEFQHLEYEGDLKKVYDLLSCIQTSVKAMIERTSRFASADFSLVK